MLNNYTPKVFTVSQLNQHISRLIESDPELGVLFVEGEISNLKINSKSGHMYFSLKDKNSVINAVMFSFNRRNLRFAPEIGMKVIMRASVTVYEPMGQYQLRVEDMQPDGVGVLAMQLEQLKKKLAADGLFAPEHKKPIPPFPEVIGVITSPTGAAIRDILDILGRRFPCASIVLAPVLVQGDSAPAQLAGAVRKFSENHAADVIIIGRGGGSMEDLWAFNDEGLARAVYDCEIPVISAVGHETDTTICDFVSDLRAPTPSAAAELAVPDRMELLAHLDVLSGRARTASSLKVRTLAESFQKTVSLAAAYSPLDTVQQYEELLDAQAQRALMLSNTKLDSAASDTAALAERAASLNPIAVLNRGYAYITMDGKNVSTAARLQPGDAVRIRLKDGIACATVDAVDTI